MTQEVNSKYGITFENNKIKKEFQKYLGLRPYQKRLEEVINDLRLNPYKFSYEKIGSIHNNPVFSTRINNSLRISYYVKDGKVTILGIGTHKEVYGKD